jgi:hypothetical protein
MPGVTIQPRDSVREGIGALGVLEKARWAMALKLGHPDTCNHLH